MQLRGFSAIACAVSVVGFGSSAAGGSPVQEVPFDCRARSSNDGCQQSVACPAGTSIRSARAACNLEHGEVTDQQLDTVEPGYLQVVRRSDRPDEGQCWLGEARLESGRVAIPDLAGLSGVTAGCQEHDRNGGDCQIRGSLYCR